VLLDRLPFLVQPGSFFFLSLSCPDSARERRPSVSPRYRPSRQPGQGRRMANGATDTGQPLAPIDPFRECF